MRKIGNDLKVGDTCYSVESNGNISKEKITSIKKYDSGDITMEFNGRVFGASNINSETSSYGGYACIVCFSKEKAKEILEKKIEDIQNNIVKLDTL